MTNTMLIMVSIAVFIFIAIAIAFFFGMKRLETNSLRRKQEHAEQKREQKLRGRGDKTV